ncbi:hypothetical protein IW150_006764, partial [Coemansia sp. RSA 2607]
MSSPLSGYSPQDVFESEKEGAPVEATVAGVETGDATDHNDDLDDLFGAEDGSDVDNNTKESAENTNDGEPSQDSAPDDDGGYPNIMAMPKIPKRTKKGDPQTNTSKQSSRHARRS